MTSQLSRKALVTLGCISLKSVTTEDKNAPKNTLRANGFSNPIFITKFEFFFDF
jgi:hypothetical protein